jgi:hypothetical protein
MLSRRHLLAAAASLAVPWTSTRAIAQPESEAARVTAAAVRDRGLPCTEPVSAQRDAAASRPDEVVWVLVCSDARYRVRFMGDRPAQIERLE